MGRNRCRGRLQRLRRLPRGLADAAVRDDLHEGRDVAAARERCRHRGGGRDRERVPLPVEYSVLLSVGPKPSSRSRTGRGRPRAGSRSRRSGCTGSYTRDGVEKRIVSGSSSLTNVSCFPCGTVGGQPTLAARGQVPWPKAKFLMTTRSRSGPPRSRNGLLRPGFGRRTTDVAFSAAAVREVVGLVDVTGERIDAAVGTVRDADHHDAHHLVPGGAGSLS